jgi:beta-phosphoglucomutase
MLEAIVFDFDGVIVDTEPLHYRSFQIVLDPLDITLDHDCYRELALGRSDRAGLEAVCERYQKGFTDKLLTHLLEQKAATMQQLAALGVTPCPGAVDLVRTAADSLPLGLCTGALQRDVDAILPAIPPGNLKDFFQAIVTADDVTHSKPDPECYSLTVQRLHAAAHCCLAIEDTPSGIRAARSAGLFTVAVARTCPSSELQEADHVVPSLEEATLEGLQALMR